MEKLVIKIQKTKQMRDVVYNIYVYNLVYDTKIMKLFIHTLLYMGFRFKKKYT